MKISNEQIHRSYQDDLSFEKLVETVLWKNPQYPTEVVFIKVYKTYKSFNRIFNQTTFSKKKSCSWTICETLSKVRLIISTQRCTHAGGATNAPRTYTVTNHENPSSNEFENKNTNTPIIQQNFVEALHIKEENSQLNWAHKRQN